ncbi:MAG: hypothetical protein MRZ79_08300 [Bacteroidia bacterium]|nr:hypothetical protein [Bacteroidia bacterium]
MNKAHNRIIVPLLLFLFLASNGMANIPTYDSHPPRWEQLGMKKVNYRVERDEIFVTAREGTFTAVKLRVLKAPINMRKMVIHYRNGSTQEVVLKKNFARGGESRVIDLKGGKRVIKKVVFWYDSKNYSRSRATIQLWGRY